MHVSFCIVVVMMCMCMVNMVLTISDLCLYNSAFLFYHIYLVYRGTTTNEASKWSKCKYIFIHIHMHLSINILMHMYIHVHTHTYTILYPYTPLGAMQSAHATLVQAHKNYLERKRKGGVAPDPAHTQTHTHTSSENTLTMGGTSNT
ncbi:hypothetical protein EON63_17580, partial [archaeon]